MAESTFATFVKDIADGPEEARLALAQKLKDAGLWKGKISSKMDIKYYNALLKLEENFKQQEIIDKQIGAAKPTARYDVLTSLLEDGGASGSGGSGGSTTTANRYITSASQTSKLLNTVAQDLLGRKLTKAEQAKYTKILNAQQQKEPAMTTSGSGFSTTRGGVDEEAFITEQISATDEAKTSKATDAYTIMLDELGGLR